MCLISDLQMDEGDKEEQAPAKRARRMSDDDDDDDKEDESSVSVELLRGGMPGLYDFNYSVNML